MNCGFSLVFFMAVQLAEDDNWVELVEEMTNPVYINSYFISSVEYGGEDNSIIVMNNGDRFLVVGDMKSTLDDIYRQHNYDNGSEE